MIGSGRPVGDPQVALRGSPTARPARGTAAGGTRCGGGSVGQGAGCPVVIATVVRRTNRRLDSAGPSCADPRARSCRATGRGRKGFRCSLEVRRHGRRRRKTAGDPGAARLRPMGPDGVWRRIRWDNVARLAALAPLSWWSRGRAGGRAPAAAVDGGAGRDRAAPPAAAGAGKRPGARPAGGGRRRSGGRGCSGHRGRAAIAGRAACAAERRGGGRRAARGGAHRQPRRVERPARGAPLGPAGGAAQAAATRRLTWCSWRGGAYGRSPVKRRGRRAARRSGSGVWAGAELETARTAWDWRRSRW
jgi:hypothetical protein